MNLPTGPWVLVVGMHRSGTSAVAGALAELGLALPAAGDLMKGRPDNPVHHESRALVDFDDGLLRTLGGSWSAPPQLDPAWERSPVATAMVANAGRAARRAFPPKGPLVWKDPRLCLLLPFWRPILPPPFAAVFVWRSPLAVARSLRARQSFTLSHGLALWDIYVRDALRWLRGLNVYVLDFDEMLRDPSDVVRDCAGWLYDSRCLPGEVQSGQLDAATASVSAPMARHGGDGDVPEVVEAAVDALGALGGAHEQLPAVELPLPPSWMADAIRQRHDYEEIYAKYLRYAKWRRKIRLAR